MRVAGGCGLRTRRRTVAASRPKGSAVKFVQVIEFDSSKRDEMQKIADEWEAAIGADSKAVRRVFCQDRDRPGHYVNIVTFDSYEEAMENSNHPVTNEFSQKMMALADGPPKFYNLDVLEERG